MDSNIENSNIPNKSDEGGKDTDRGQSNMQNHNSKDEDANSAKNTQAICADPRLVNIYKITKMGDDSSGNKSIYPVLKSEHNGKYFAERSIYPVLKSKHNGKYFAERSKYKIKKIDRLPILQPVDKGETVPSSPVLPIGSHQTSRHLHSSYPMPQAPPPAYPNLPTLSAQHALLPNPQFVQANAKNHISEKPTYSYTEDTLPANNSSGVSETGKDSGYCGSCASMVNSNVKLLQQLHNLNAVIGQRETKLQEARVTIDRSYLEIDKLNREKGELLQDVQHLNSNMKKITNKNETDHNHLKQRLEELQQHLGWPVFGFLNKRNKDMDQKQIFEELFKQLEHSKNEIKAKDDEMAELKDKFNKKTKQQTNILKEKDITMKQLEQNYDALSRKAYQLTNQNTDLKEKLSEKDKELTLKCKDKDDTINYLRTEVKDIYNALFQAKDDCTVLEKRLRKIADEQQILSEEFIENLVKMRQFVKTFNQPITIDQVQLETKAESIKNSLEKIRQVEAKARQYEDEIRTFHGNLESKAYLDIMEKLSKTITDELDTIECQVNMDIRYQRKEAIVYIQNLKKELEKKARETG